MRVCIDKARKDRVVPQVNLARTGRNRKFFPHFHDHLTTNDNVPVGEHFAAFAVKESAGMDNGGSGVTRRLRDSKRARNSQENKDE